MMPKLTNRRGTQPLLPALPKVPGWPTRTSEVISDEGWEALSKDLETFEIGGKEVLAGSRPRRLGWS
jgi:hypothetical protein